jgi:hypothetical protein
MFGLAVKANLGKSQTSQTLWTATGLALAPEVTTPSQLQSPVSRMPFPSPKTLCNSFHSRTDTEAATH